MCVKPKSGEKVVPVRCRPVSYPCPTCGRRGHRKRLRGAYEKPLRQAGPNRILDDGLNVERTRKAMNRAFLLELSNDFIYKCLDWGLTQLNETQRRRETLKHFSGYLNIDELHLGDYTLLLATDPLTDRVVGHRLVKVN